MNTHIISLSIKGANTLKKARGFKNIDRAGVQVWEKIGVNKSSEATRHLIFPSGTNVIYSEGAGLTTKKIIKPDGTFFKSIFSKYGQDDGHKKFVCASSIDLKNQKVQRYSDSGQGIKKTENYQIRHNVFGTLSLLHFILK